MALVKIKQNDIYNELQPGLEFEKDNRRLSNLRARASAIHATDHTGEDGLGGIQV